MIGEELVFLSFLYIKPLALGVHAFNNRSAVTHHKVNLFKWVMGGTQLEQESWLEPYISPVPSAFQQPPSGGYGVNAGRMQQSCGNKAMRCKNHKVLNCMYGMCGTCCTGAARQPLCNIARHYKNNKYT